MSDTVVKRDHLHQILRLNYNNNVITPIMFFFYIKIFTISAIYNINIYNINNISNAINSLNSTDFIRVILYGDKIFDNVTNLKIITATIKFIKTTKPFEEALF